MIELSKHIESLLLKHNCVIIPGLGGFVTQYMPARYIEEENLYLPPYRSVGFNARLTLNDGLLVQSYMQACDTSYPEAVRIIDEAVSDIKRELQEKGEFELNGIGRLTLNVNGLYDFDPSRSGVLSPELYGLDSFCIERIERQQEAAAPKTPKKKRSRIIKKTAKAYEFSINKEIVNYVAAAVVALFFYFVWATPVNDISTARPNEASMFSHAIVPEKAAPAPKAATPKAKVATPVGAPAEKAAAQKAPLPETKPDVQPQERFTIVLASSITKKNAETFVEQLKAQGITGTEVVQRRKMVRVVCNRYATQDEAQAALNSLRSKALFSEAWVLELK